MPAKFRKRFYCCRIVQNQPLMLERGYDTPEDAMKYAAELPRGAVVKVMEHVEGFGDGDDLESYVNIDLDSDSFDAQATADSGTPPGRFARQQESQGATGAIRDRAATGAGGGPRIANQVSTPTNETREELAKQGEKDREAADKLKEQDVVVGEASVKDAPKLNAEKEDAPSARRKQQR